MPYADTDFFFALIKSSDRLNQPAVAIYEKYKGQIYTSLAVIIEILLISKKHNVPPKLMVERILGVAKVYQADPAAILSAAQYIEEQNVSIFDAFHAAFCDGTIISSDHIYDKMGIKRIVL